MQRYANVIRQEMPPPGGFKYPVFRSSNLQRKWFGTYGSLALVCAMSTYSFFKLRAHYNASNDKSLNTAELASARGTVLRTLYGRPDKYERNSYTGLFFRYDNRPEVFVDALAMHEQAQWVDKFQATRALPEVAPYQICYGADHWNVPHVCNDTCISPAELEIAKAKLQV